MDLFVKDGRGWWYQYLDILTVKIYSNIRNKVELTEATRQHEHFLTMYNRRHLLCISDAYNARPYSRESERYICISHCFIKGLNLKTLSPFLCLLLSCPSGLCCCCCWQVTVRNMQHLGSLFSELLLLLSFLSGMPSACWEISDYRTWSANVQCIDITSDE